MKKIFLGTVLLLMTSIGFGSQAVLLVSLGMPDNALKAYLKQAKQYHIPVVIRGFYTDKKNQPYNPYVGSFKDTANRVKKLVHESKVGGVSINPLLFRAFNVKVVPALVIYNDNLSCIKQTTHASYTQCSTDSFDVVLGNLPISKLLSIVAHQSTSPARSDFSKSILNQYRKEEGNV